MSVVGQVQPQAKKSLLISAPKRSARGVFQPLLASSLALECALARHLLVEHRTESKNVRAGVRFLAFKLLWRHVLEGADNGAFFR
jgi:hypothetical protein